MMLSGIGAGSTVRLKTLFAVCGAGAPESVARMVKLLVPAAAGVPEITPVAEESASPAGKLPENSDHA